MPELKYRLMCTSNCSSAYACSHPNVPNSFKPSYYYYYYYHYYYTAWCALRKIEGWLLHHESHPRLVA